MIATDILTRWAFFSLLFFVHSSFCKNEVAITSKPSLEAAGATHLNCPPKGWTKTEDGKSCFKLFADPMPMESAEAYCEEYGGHLAILDNENYAEKVRSMISSSDDNFWIGLKQKNGSQEDNTWSFLWIDRTPVNYQRFPASNPQSHGGKQKCVVTQMNGWSWVCKDCAIREPFICQVSSQAAVDFTTAYPITTPTLTIPCNSDGKVDGWIANPKDTDPQSCYLFPQDMTNKLDYQAATKSCYKRGGSLVSIHSEEENAFVMTNINKQNAWIGFNSMYSGEFRWTDGSEVGYQRWDPNEPNGADKQEDCVEINGETGGWNDLSCNDPRTLACKKQRNDVITTPKPTNAPTGFCPSNEFFEIDGYCYKLNKQSTTWENARQKCKDFGDHYNLASIHSDKENALVSSMLYANTNHQNQQVWIGGSVEGQTSAKWTWSDYSTFNVEYWAPNEPNNTMNMKNCLAMYTDAVDLELGTWSDEDCTKDLNFVCKGPTSPNNSPAVKPKCKLTGFESFVPYKNNCYMEYNMPVTWSESEAHCRSMGAHLVSIRDWSEQAGIFSVIKGESVWIGLGNVQPKMNVAFWSDGFVMGIHNWAAHILPDQPSCIYMNSTDGKWYPQECNSKMNYVCKASDDPHPKEGPDFKGYCPEGFEDEIPEGNNCYSIEKGHGHGLEFVNNWSHGVLECKEKGANLASITSAEENNALMELWKKKKVTDDVGFWIGLVAYRDAVGLGPTWRWSDGSNLSNYSNWDQDHGYPQNQFSTAPQCAYITTSGQWRNTECHRSRYGSNTPQHHICKAPKAKNQDIPFPDPNLSQGLSAGGTAAIVICSLLGVAGIIVGTAVVLKKKNVSIAQLLNFKSGSSDKTLSARASKHRSIGGVDNVTYGIDA